MTHKLTIILLALLISSASYAQCALSSAGNALRADSLQQEIINFVEPGCSGENITWEAVTDSEEVGGNSTMQYYDLVDHLLLDNGSSLTTYLPAADSLLISRIEAPRYEMNYSTPLVALTFPFYYGNSISNPFAGTGEFEGKILLNETGMNHVIADGYGSLVLAEGDTIRNVLRVFTQRSADVKLTGKETGEDFGTLQKVTNIYEWYARGYRYPVLRSIEEQIFNSGTLLQSANITYRISPEEQELLVDKENELVRQCDALAAAASNPMHNIAVHSDGNTAMLTYDLDTEANVCITLADAMGISYWNYSGTEGSGQGFQEIPVSSLHRGQYIIHINANGSPYAVTFNK